MSSKIIQRLALWERQIPRYPVYWEGNPQNRVFLCPFWMKMVKPPRSVPPHQVHFEVHPQMSKLDIKQYLKKIYNVPVMSVRTHYVEGKKRRMGTKDVKDPDRKLAYVHLVRFEDYMSQLHVPLNFFDLFSLHIKWRFRDPTNVFKTLTIHKADGKTFTFPSFFEDKSKPSTEEERTRSNEREKADEATKQNWDRLPLPPWFR